MKEDVRENAVAEMYPEQALTGSILEAAFAVHNTLGVGFLEKVYANAMGLELRAKNLRCETEVPYNVRYRNVIIGEYFADLVVEQRVLVELKAAVGNDPAHEAQILNYLKVSGLRVGLLLNFGKPKLQYKRFIR